MNLEILIRKPKNNNKKKFKGLAKDKEELFQLTSKIFNKPWETLNDSEKNIIVSAMLNIQFFHDAIIDPQDIKNFIIKCCELMTFEHIPKGNVIFHYGDKNFKLYIIIKGLVGIYMPRPESEIKKDIEKIQIMESIPNESYANNTRFLEKNNKEVSNLRENRVCKTEPEKHNDIVKIDRTFTKAKTFKDNLKPLLRNISLPNHMPDQQNEAYIELNKTTNILPPNHYIHGIPKFMCAKTSGPGSYFGEIALTSTKPRMTTNLAIEDTYLLCLSQDNYKMVFDYQLEKYKEKFIFFANLLHGCSMDAISQFAISCSERLYKFEQKIYLQGELPTGLHIIKSGEIQLLTCEKKSNKPGQNEDFKYFMCNSTFLKQEKQLLRTMKDQRLIANKIANIGPGNFFGEEDIFTKSPNRSTAISMDSSTIIYWVSIEDCEDLFKRFPELIKNIKNKTEAKSSFNNERLVNLNNIKDQLEKLAKNKFRSRFEKWYLPTEGQLIIHRKSQILKKMPSRIKLNQELSFAPEHSLKDFQSSFRMSLHQKDQSSKRELETNNGEKVFNYEQSVKNQSEIKNYSIDNILGKSYRSISLIEKRDRSDSDKPIKINNNNSKNIDDTKKNQDLFSSGKTLRFSFLEYKKDEKLKNTRLRKEKKKRRDEMLDLLHSSPVKVYKTFKQTTPKKELPSSIQEIYTPITRNSTSAIKHTKPINLFKRGERSISKSEKVYASPVIEVNALRSKANINIRTNKGENFYLSEESSSIDKLSTTPIPRNLQTPIDDFDSNTFASSAIQESQTYCQFPSSHENIVGPNRLYPEVINSNIDMSGLPVINAGPMNGNNFDRSFKKLNFLTNITDSNPNFGMTRYLNGNSNNVNKINIDNMWLIDGQSENVNVTPLMDDLNQTYEFRKIRKQKMRLPVLGNINVPKRHLISQSPIQPKDRSTSFKSEIDAVDRSMSYQSYSKANLDSSQKLKVFLNGQYFTPDGKLVTNSQDIEKKIIF